MKKIIIIVALVFIGLGVTAQEIMRRGILPKIEFGMGYSEYGPLTVAGIGTNYEDFSFTTGILLISRVTELNIHQTEYMGVYFKIDLNIISMLQKSFESRMQFRFNMLLAYGNKENTIGGLFEKEMSTILSPGVIIGYELGRFDLGVLIQYSGLEANNEHDGRTHIGFIVSVFL